MQLPPDLAAMLSAFEKFEVRYLVIGLHARPRSTKDLDLWLDAARTNIVRCLQRARRVRGSSHGARAELR